MKIDSVSNNGHLNQLDKLKEPKENNGKGQDKKNNPVPVDTGPVSPVPVNPPPVTPQPVNPIEVNPVIVNPTPANQVPVNSQTLSTTYTQSDQWIVRDVSTEAIKNGSAEDPFLRSARNKLQSQPAGSESNSNNALKMFALKVKSFVVSNMVNTGDQNIVKAVNEQIEQENHNVSVASPNKPKPVLEVSISEQVQLQPDLKTDGQGANVSKPMSPNMSHSNGSPSYPRIDILA